MLPPVFSASNDGTNFAALNARNSSHAASTSVVSRSRDRTRPGGAVELELHAHALALGILNIFAFIFTWI